jgi:hypothetical protein
VLLVLLVLLVLVLLVLVLLVLLVLLLLVLVLLVLLLLLLVLLLLLLVLVLLVLLLLLLVLLLLVLLLLVYWCWGCWWCLLVLSVISSFVPFSFPRFFVSSFLRRAVDGTNFTIRMDRLFAASRIRPRYIAGTLLGYGSLDRKNDCSNGSTQRIYSADAKGAESAGFWMQARCDGNSSTVPRTAVTARGVAFTEVYFPAHYSQCASSTRVNGTAHLRQLAKNADGSVVAVIACDRSGVFHVSAMC